MNEKEVKALESLKIYYNIINRIPKRKDFENNKWYPHYDWYTQHFGNMKNACYFCGLIEKPLTREERIEFSIIELQELARQLNKCPTVYQFDNYVKRGYKRRELERYINLKYNDICKKYIPQYLVNIDRDITKEEIIDALKDVYNKLGRVPLCKEFYKYYGYTHILFKSKFNMTYNQIIRSLGWKPLGNDTLKRSEETLLNDFYNYFKELRRIPYGRDLNNNKKIASSPTYIKYFGSTRNICELLNIDFDLYYNGSGAGKICLDINNDICRSLIEKDITNFYIINNIKYEKETPYAEIIEKSEKRFDWKIKIEGIEYYVEYFGMFNSNQRGSIGKRYFRRAKSKISLLYRKGYIKNCIFIFPYDVKYFTIAEIFKKYFNKDFINVEYSRSDILIEYENLTDIELLNNVMKYSKHDGVLPSTRVISKKESGIYKEIIRRYKTYYSFAEIMGVYSVNKPQDYWTKENVFKVFDYMIDTYGKILSATIKNKFDIHIINIPTILKHYNWFDIKLDYFNDCIKKNKIISEYELQWIHKVANNIGSGIKNRVTDIQIVKAQKILIDYKNKMVA